MNLQLYSRYNSKKKKKQKKIITFTNNVDKWLEPVLIFKIWMG